MGKLLAAEPVGPEQHGLPLVVEVLAEEVEYGATRIGIGAHARILYSPARPFIVAICLAVVAPGKSVSERAWSAADVTRVPARPPDANVAV